MLGAPAPQVTASDTGAGALAILLSRKSSAAWKSAKHLQQAEPAMTCSIVIPALVARRKRSAARKSGTHFQQADKAATCSGVMVSHSASQILRSIAERLHCKFGLLQSLFESARDIFLKHVQTMPPYPMSHLCIAIVGESQAEPSF